MTEKGWYAKNKEKGKAQTKKWADANRDKIKKKTNKEGYRKHWPKKAWTHAKKRVIKFDVPFNIEISDVVMPDVCPVLGISIMIGNEGFQDNSPTIDRIIPNLGYIKGNTEVISFRANRIKNDASLSELIKIVKWMEKKL